ncbi:MAG: tetratricopeptide repeat protein [Marinicellaceae bacterium]
MKFILLLTLLTFQSVAQEIPKTIDLENIATKGLDKNVAKVFHQTKELILKARKEENTSIETEGIKQWCYLLHNYNFLDQAKSCYYWIGMQFKTDARWPYLFAKATHESGDLDSAINGYKQALMRQKNYLPAHYHLIRIAMQKGDLHTAFELYSQVPTVLRLTSSMINLTGDLFAQVENHHIAIGYYQQALQLLPEANSLHYKIAQNYQMLEMPDLAQEYLSKAGQIRIALIDPYYQDVKNTIIGEIPYLIKAKTALQQLNFKQAIVDYNKALEFNPKSNTAKTNIAVAYFQDNQIDKAQEIFENLIEESHDNLKVLYNLAVIAKVQNNITTAINYYKKYRSLDNQDTLVNNELAEIYYALKKYEKVIELAEEKIMATDEKMQLSKAKSLVHLQRYDEAIELLTEIDKYKPNNNEVMLLLAKLYSQVPDKSLRNAEQSLKYALKAYNNSTDQLSYWQLLMALDESQKCSELNNKMKEFSLNYKIDKQQVISRFALQRGDELRCQLD